VKTIRQIANERGVSPQAIYKKLNKLGIKPVIDPETRWRKLSAAQERQMDKPGPARKKGKKS
jgi:Zn-dependent peptidase ImmA (M78 family)